MKKNNDPFFAWVKNHITYTPNSLTDQKILAMAKESLQPQKISIFNNSWLKPGFAIALSFVFIFVLNTKLNHQQATNRLFVQDSSEMILQYEYIELMAAAATLSDKEWQEIEGPK